MPIEAEKLTEVSAVVSTAEQSRNRLGFFRKHWPWLVLILVLIWLLWLSVAPLVEPYLKHSQPPRKIPPPKWDTEDKVWLQHFLAGRRAKRSHNDSLARAEFEQALRQSIVLGKDDPRYCQSLGALGEAAYHAGDLAQAEDLLKKQREFLISLSPDFSALIHPCLLLASIENDLGKYNDALALAKESLEILHENPSYNERPYEVVFELAISNFGLQKRAEAAALTKSAIELMEKDHNFDDYDFGLRLQVNVMTGRVDRTTPAPAKVLLEAAACAMSTYIAQQEAIGPNRIRMQHYLQYAKILASLGQTTEFAATLEKAYNHRSKLDPPVETLNLGQQYFALAQQYNNANDSRNSIKAANTAYQILSATSDLDSSDRAISIRAQGEFAMGNYAAAKETLKLRLKRLADRKPPPNAEIYDTHLRIGFCDFNLRDYKAAEADYKRALDIANPTFGHSSSQACKAMLELGKALFEENKLPEAQATIEEGLKYKTALAPGEFRLVVLAQLALSATYLRTGNTDLANKLFAETSKMANDSKDPAALVDVEAIRNRWFSTLVPKP